MALFERFNKETKQFECFDEQLQIYGYGETEEDARFNFYDEVDLMNACGQDQ